MRNIEDVRACISDINEKTITMSEFDDNMTTLKEGTANYIKSAKTGQVIQFQDTDDGATNTTFYVVNRTDGTQLECMRVTITNSNNAANAGIKCDAVSITATDFMRHKTINILGSLAESTVISKSLSQILRSTFAGIFKSVTVKK